MTRDERRARTQRIWERRRNYLTTADGQQWEKVRENPKPCSCDMCGNRRKLCGPTRQERQADMAMAEQLAEAELCAP